MTTYYNENDPKAAAWLRELIRENLIAKGDVDERSIAEVRPDDLAGYTQCHFFAGIGGWSYALRLAGWSDNRPVWTGSCPCQPFSVAGKRGGEADERHLFPVWRELIAKCDPAVVFGEQVASKAGRLWLNTVRLEMEALGYAIGAADLCAAGVGAPHIRQRLWFVGERLGNAQHSGLEGLSRDGNRSHEPGRLGEEPGRPVAQAGGIDGLADTDSSRSLTRGKAAEAAGHGGTSLADGGRTSARPTNGYWRDADWLGCRDGKFRPVEPGTFPLAHGPAARVGRLRGYGNAIVPQVAAEFISSYMEAA